MSRKLRYIVIILALISFLWLGFIGGQKLNERFDAISRAEQVARGYSTNYELSEITLISATKVSETIWIVKFRGEFVSSPPPGLSSHFFSFIDIRLNMAGGSVISVSMHN